MLVELPTDCVRRSVRSNWSSLVNSAVSESDGCTSNQSGLVLNYTILNEERATVRERIEQKCSQSRPEAFDCFHQTCKVVLMFCSMGRKMKQWDLRPYLRLKTRANWMKDSCWRCTTQRRKRARDYLWVIRWSYSDEYSTFADLSRRWFDTVVEWSHWSWHPSGDPESKDETIANKAQLTSSINRFNWPISSGKETSLLLWMINTSRLGNLQRGGGI